MTLYDTQGYKINILNPDDGSCNSVDPLCPLPVFYSSLYGFVAHVTETSVFIQPSQYVDTIAQLLDQLYEMYNNSINEVPVIPEIGSTYVAHSEDSNWYRCQVTTVDGENVTVTYVDYGNSEVVAVTELRELAEQFWSLHMLALKVSIHNLKCFFAVCQLHVMKFILYSTKLHLQKIIIIDEFTRSLRLPLLNRRTEHGHRCHCVFKPENLTVFAKPQYIIF